jgi:hypothetical protein
MGYFTVFLSPLHCLPLRFSVPPVRFFFDKAKLIRNWYEQATGYRCERDVRAILWPVVCSLPLPAVPH